MADADTCWEVGMPDEKVLAARIVKPKLSDELVETVGGAVAHDRYVASVARSFGASRPTTYKALETTPQ